MVCPKCKTNNKAGAKFCEKCGAGLGEGKSPSGLKRFILPIIGLAVLVGVGFFAYTTLSNRPGSVVKRFYKALSANDLTSTLALVVPEKRLEAKAGLESFLDTIESLEIKRIKVSDVVISDDSASVSVKMDFEITLKSGQKFTYLASKDKMIIFDGKTKVEVPISEAEKYSQAQVLLAKVDLEKIKGKWYISY